MVTVGLKIVQVRTCQRLDLAIGLWKLTKFSRRMMLLSLIPCFQKC